MASLGDRIYNTSPALLQSMLMNMYAVYLNLHRYNRTFYRQLHVFLENPWKEKGQIRQMQSEKLRELIEHCYYNIPYYTDVMREVGLKPGDIQTHEDLHKLPVLTREDVKKQFSQLMDKRINRVNKRLLILGHTSGTTGSPLEFYWDRNTSIINNVVHWRQKKWAGIEMHEKSAVLLGRTIVPTEQQKPPYWKMNRIHNTLWMSSFHLKDENLKQYVEKLSEYKPSYIEGYPSTLFILAKYMNENNLSIKMKAALTSSETLHPQMREEIGNAFNCDVFDYYGLAERSIFATECEKHGGKHDNPDFGITEIVDQNGQPVENGELGWLVGTNLYNYAMPLLRYKTNDISAFTGSECSCGMNFPKLEDVTTKAEDIITTIDGKFISSSILTHPFKPQKNIKASQIIQEKNYDITINIVKGENYTKNDEELLKYEMQGRLGKSMKINIRYVERIERSASGKFRWVISRVPLKIGN